MHCRNLFIILLLAIIALALMAVTVQPQDHGLVKLQQKWQQWKSAHINHYMYQLRIDCFCPFGGIPVDVEVRSGEAISIKNATTGEAVPHHFFTSYNTIDRIFDEIQRELETHAEQVPNERVISGEFDPMYGFPTRFEVNYTNPGNDANIIYTIEKFKILDCNL
jgi:hypothetical protein